MLVGAPQASALPSQAANRTGGLFACPLTPEPSDCWRVPIDEGGNLRVELLNQSSLDFLRYDDGPYEAGGEKDQDPSLIPVPANSYFGFSVDSGAGLTRRRELSFVSGAPRANHTGAVVILRRDSAHRLVPEAVLPGEQLTSAFGYALAVLDLNSDGARPVVYISRNVSLLPANIDLEQSNCQHQEGICVDVQACFSYTATPASYSPPLVLEYVFDADTERRRLGHPPRVTFLGRRPSDPEHQFSRTAELPRQHARTCTTATFQLQDSIRDKLRPITVTLAYGIQGAGTSRHSRAATLPPLPPVLSPQQPSSHRTEVHFLKQGCGDDKICQSNLQLRFQFCTRLGDADFMPLPKGADGTAIFAMSDQKDVALEIHVTNMPSDPAEPQRDGDDAHEAVLTARFPQELPYSAVRPYDGRAAPVRISEQPTLEPVVARARVVIELPLSVTGVAVPPRLFFGGTVRGESAVRHESQVGSAVLFEVTVSGEPPGEAGVTEEPAAGSWWVPAPAEKRRNVTLDCAQGTARCLAFRCPLHSFERAAVLTARGRLWNSTFLEEYLAVTSVELIVRASVSVTSSIKNLVLKDASTQIPVTIYLDPGVAVAGGVPWWVILLAVLAGILVLALLIFILWKCGFFKRSSPTSRYTANYYRARRGLQPSEVDKQALQGQR
ncbi:UNVERIFIED_CONTAM: hypothetical protein H355_005441 [Colinus virginianus]|nr:hypothetical protein H355_005441 [Colinus virginianus]